MKWEGEAYFGASLIVFRGQSVANALHAMPVSVLAMAHDREPVMLDANGAAMGGPVCYLDPMTPHIVAPARPVTIAFLSPAKWSLERVRVQARGEGFAQLDPAGFPDLAASNLADIARWLEDTLRPEVGQRDARLEAALAMLEREPGAVSIKQAARDVGVSSSHLRALAQRDLGASLSHWLIWKKLEHAARSVTTGEALAQSAASGGFVDQAHFANVMRRLLGAAPSEIAPVRAAN